MASHDRDQKYPDDNQYDLFISYARADNKPVQDGESGWISAFVEALLDEHQRFTGGRRLRAFFDKKDIHVGQNWRLRLAGALHGTKQFVAFLSPAYFASEWCRREWKTWIDVEIAKHVLSDGVMPIYIVQVPGFDGKDALSD